MPTLSAIYRYPIKSTAGQRLTRVRVESEGLAQDRRFMLVKPDGAFVTARRHAGLQRVVARFDGHTLSVAHDDQVGLSALCSSFSRQPVATGVWADRFTALSTTMALDAWFSRVIGEPVRLLWLGERSSRYSAKAGTPVSFADGYPLLLTCDSSLAELNARTDGTHVMAQFRPNIVISGTAAYAEDGWHRIRIGDAVFRLDTPCARCVMITVDPARGERRPDGEPMRTLLSYRKRQAQPHRDKPAGKDVYFGQNLVVETAGEIAAGQDVEILA